MTLVIAHRTCARHARENTVAGIARAGQLDADGVEMDVRLTRDGEPVLLHDALLLRTAFLPLPVRAMRLATIRRTAGRAGRVPTLAAALDAAHAQARPLRPVLDVKAPAAAPAVLALLQARLETGASLWSQHEAAVVAFARAAVSDDVALLRDTFSEADRDQLLRDAVRCGASAVSAHWDAVDARFVRQAGDAGIRVYSWCQWRHRHAEKAGLGLAGVVTDWPDVARQAGL